MKILYVFFHSYNDMPYHVREWVEAAIELGNKVTVLTSIDSEFLKRIGWENKIKVVQVKYPGHGMLNYLKLLKNFKKAINYEIEGKKPDLIYERFSAISPATATAKREINYTIEINGIIDEELAVSHSSFFRRFFFRVIQSFVYKRCDNIITVTDYIKKWIISKYNIHKEMIKTIPNGVNVDRFKSQDMTISRQKFNLLQGKFIIGYLGTLCPWYDLKILIRTANNILKAIPEAFFVIGGGQEPMKSELEKLVQEKNLMEYFYFSGQVPWDDAPFLTSAFDVAIAPIKFIDKQYEVSPLKLASYMACERLVIGSNTPGMKEIINETKCGKIYNSDESFVNCLAALYNTPIYERNSLKKQGRTFIERNFTWKILVKNTIDFINSRKEGNHESQNFG